MGATETHALQAYRKASMREDPDDLVLLQAVSLKIKDALKQLREGLAGAGFASVLRLFGIRCLALNTLVAWSERIVRRKGCVRIVVIDPLKLERLNLPWWNFFFGQYLYRPSFPGFSR